MVQPSRHPMTGARPVAAGPRSLYDLEAADLARLVEETGEPPYRGRQLTRWLDRRKVADLEAMTDLPAGFRARLAERLAGAGLVLERHQVGDAGWTHKFLFGLPGGDSVESVLMLYPPVGGGGSGGLRSKAPTRATGREAKPSVSPPVGQAAEHEDWEAGSPSGRQGRATLCISTQAGCAMGCTFCATGQFGFTRNLSSGEV